MGELLFGKDVRIVTQFPVALESRDTEHPEWSGSTHDFTDGTEFALELMQAFPGKRTLLDLGTATGSVPLTMRKAGMLAVGLEGSDIPQETKIGAWKEMPDIVRTCDISKPFEIVSQENGDPITFDFITAWGVMEHILLKDFCQTLINIQEHMNDESIAILNIDIGYNPADGLHLLWRNWQGGDELQEKLTILRFMLSEFFHIDAEDHAMRDWNYCRPTKAEREANERLGVHKHSGRSFWWLKKK